MPADPSADYHARLTRWREQLAALSNLDARLAAARLMVFVAAAALGIAYLQWRAPWAAWLLMAPVAAFILIAIRHDRVIRDRDRSASLVAFYERGLARIEDRWAGTGSRGDRYRSDLHPYANDLDLFGAGSLFELLSLARTRTGEDTLAAWLTGAAPPPVVIERQAAVRDLIPALDVREDLSLAIGRSGTSVDAAALSAWAEAPTHLSPPAFRYVALALTALTVAAAVFVWRGGNEVALVFAVAAQLAFGWPYGRKVEPLLHAADGPTRDLTALLRAVVLLERGRFSSPRLTLLQTQLRETGSQASTAIARLRRIIEMHDWQHNMVFTPIAFFLMWSIHLAWALEAWRARHGAHVHAWLRIIGEFEALASLSAYAFEHPADPFPVFTTTEGQAQFAGTGLGHPLVAASRMQTNEVSLTPDRQLLVVSGSNMSGKSTFLRTVGINAVLAQAGAPVRAQSLRMSALTVGATLRIQDSLQEGRSRFFAEISRIRELAGLARGPVPLLFLLDEIFHGTNSHDRLVGASGVLRSLLDRGAIGLVTTHDLSLTAIVESLGSRAANVHFEDSFDGHEMHFDYRVKPGPVTKSNALALMRAVGLDVEEPRDRG
jgi:hypothetical protein